MSASEINPSIPESMSPRPTPLNSLVASAVRITSEKIKNRIGFGKAETWQTDAWEMFDLVGEQRFLANTLAGRMSQARFFVGRVPQDSTEVPEPIDPHYDPDVGDEDPPSPNDLLAAQVFEEFGSSPAGRAQMVARIGVNLFIAGDGWLVGIPKGRLPGSTDDDVVVGPTSSVALKDFVWRALSVNEVAFESDAVVVSLGETQAEKVRLSPDDMFLIRVWRPHPRYHWQADAPTRSSLPVLRELVGLTMHVGAQVDSRLAGAGVFIIPQSARQALSAAMGQEMSAEEDPFTDALVRAMMTAIQDRSSAAALTPLCITVPDESVGLFQHITFSTPLDSESRNLREEAIRRLALGEDAPPELLLGSAGMNHWGAWLVREDVVTTHIEPPLSLFCDAVTTQFLWPVLVEQGMTEDEAQEYVVWYDTSHMIQRPNRLADASSLHDKGVLSDDALRKAAGFGDEDAPPVMSRSVELAIQMAVANPALVDNLKEIIAAFDEVLNPTVAEASAIEDTEAPEAGEDIVDEQGPPDTEETPAEPEAQPEAIAAAGHLTPSDASILGLNDPPTHAYLPTVPPYSHTSGARLR